MSDLIISVSPITVELTTPEDVTIELKLGQGAQGDPGEGVPVGGLTGQLLQKASDDDYDTEWTSDISVRKISFDTTSALTPETGEMVWDAETGSVDIGLNGTAAPFFTVGEDQFYRVINQSGTTIAKGTLVVAAGTVGNSGVIKVLPWDGTQPSKTIMGLTMAQILTEDDPTETGFGYVLAFGKIRGIQTNGANYGQTWVNGDVLYSNPSGGLTKVLPSAPNSKTVVALVITAHPSNGTLFVRVTPGSNLAEDELVQLASLANGDVLSYDATDARFENKTLAAAGIYATSNPAGYTTNTGTVTSVGGTGTVNGLTLSGTVTASGNLTLGGTLSGVDLSSAVTGVLPVANGGTGSSTFPASAFDYTGLVETTDWTGSGPYTAVVTVTGLLLADTPIVDIDLSGVTFADVPDVQTQWALVYKAEATGANELTLSATASPSEDFDLIIKAVR
jgi:hypothetical protein